MSDPRPPIDVRPLRAGDREDWDPLWRGYLAFYRAEVAADVTDQTFRRLCAGDEGTVGLVAVDSADRPIGLAHLLYHPSTWTATGHCYLEDLFVDPAHRGAGVARALVEAAVAHAAGRGVSRLYWTTEKTNAPARSLYDTVGRLTSFIVYERDLG